MNLALESLLFDELVEFVYEIIGLVEGHPIFPMSKFCSRFYCFILTAECK